MQSLLYEFLTEMLMLFCIDKLICKEVQIIEFDRAALRIKAVGKGEKWSREKHRHGTEIKVRSLVLFSLTAHAGHNLLCNANI